MPKEAGAAKKKPFNQVTSENVQTEIVRRVPPHSAEAEKAVLAGLFTRKNLMNILSDMLDPEDFYLPAHQVIFRAALDLYARNAPIDLVSCAETLKDKNDLETAGGAIYLGQLAQSPVLGANAEFYADLVRQKAMQRSLIEASARIIGNCFDASMEIDDLLDQSEQAVFSVSRRTAGSDFSGGRELVEKVFENLTRLAEARDVVTGVTTGYKRLDMMTSGLQPSDLIIVAARPSMGKTAFALCMAMNAAIIQNVPVAIYSLEMSKEQLMQRMLSAWGKVDLSRLRRPSLLDDNDWQNLYQAADVISRAPIYIDDSPSLSTMELRSRSRRLKSEKDLGLVVVDYLQLMRTSRKTDSRELEISDISRSLKGLAKELNIPVIALSQLNCKV